MQRTEQSVGRTSPTGQIGSRLKGVGGSTEESELEDLAQAYGARLPDSAMPPLYFQFCDHARRAPLGPDEVRR